MASLQKSQFTTFIFKSAPFATILRKNHLKGSLEKPKLLQKKNLLESLFEK